jgi:hypothetical protein
LLFRNPLPGGAGVGLSRKDKRIKEKRERRKYCRAGINFIF